MAAQVYGNIGDKQKLITNYINLSSTPDIGLSLAHKTFVVAITTKKNDKNNKNIGP
jgi:hypothetical protein